MPYWELLYHVVWATKNREPVLLPDTESQVLKLIRVKATGLGLIVHALNAMPDHVHLVVSIPPSLCVATVVGQLKGVSAAVYNSTRGADESSIHWQEGYGVFTLSRRGLARHIDYVNGQKEHHDADRVVEELEHSGDRAPSSGGQKAQATP